MANTSAMELDGLHSPLSPGASGMLSLLDCLGPEDTGDTCTSGGSSMLLMAADSSGSHRASTGAVSGNGLLPPTHPHLQAPHPGHAPANFFSNSVAAANGSYGVGSVHAAAAAHPAHLTSHPGYHQNPATTTSSAHASHAPQQMSPPLTFTNSSAPPLPAPLQHAHSAGISGGGGGGDGGGGAYAVGHSGDAQTGNRRGRKPKPRLPDLQSQIDSLSEQFQKLNQENGFLKNKLKALEKILPVREIGIDFLTSVRSIEQQQQGLQQQEQASQQRAQLEQQQACLPSAASNFSPGSAAIAAAGLANGGGGGGGGGAGVASGSAAALAAAAGAAAQGVSMHGRLSSDGATVLGTAVAIATGSGGCSDGSGASSPSSAAETAAQPLESCTGSAAPGTAAAAAAAATAALAAAAAMPIAFKTEGWLQSMDGGARAAAGRVDHGAWAPAAPAHPSGTPLAITLCPGADGEVPPITAAALEELKRITPRDFMALWKHGIMQTAVLVACAEALGPSSSQAARLERFCDRFMLYVDKIILLAPMVFWQSMYINIETGQHERPGEEFWLAIGTCANLSEQQLLEVDSMAELYERNVGPVVQERLRLTAELSAHMDATRHLSNVDSLSTKWTEVDQLAEQLQRNTIKENQTHWDIGDFLCSSVLSPLQMAKVLVASYPYIPDGVAVMLTLRTLVKK